MAKILAPNKVYAGVSAGVQFKDGAAETTHPYLIDWFREHGYTVVETTEEVVESAEPETEPEAEADEVDELEGEALDDELPEEAEVQVAKPAKVKTPRRTVRKVR